MINVFVGYIKKNKVKMILMILPVMLTVGVLFANSVSKNSQAKYVNDVIYKNFPVFQAEIVNLEKSKLRDLKDLDNVKSYKIVNYYGEASYKNLSTNPIESFDKDYFDSYRLNLLDGTYPSAKNEMIVSSDFIKDTKLNLNDNIILNIQKEYVGNNNIRTVHNDKQDFKIVGIYTSPDVMKTYGGVNNILASKLDDIPDEAITYNGYINLKTGFSNVAREVNMVSYSLDSSSDYILLNEAFERVMEESYSLSSQFDIFDKITIIASALLIFNIFVLMIREITKELGLLRVVGMSKKQTTLFLILKNLVIFICGIVSGLILGHILAYIATRNFVLTSASIDPRNAPIIYRSIDYMRPIIVMTITILISTLIPIFRLVKASPIQLYCNYVTTNSKLNKALNRIFTRKTKSLTSSLAINNIFLNFIPVVLSSVVIGISGYLYMCNYISTDADKIYTSPELQNLDGYDIELKHNGDISTLIDGYTMHDVNNIKKITEVDDIKISNTDNCYLDIDKSRISEEYKQQNMISKDSKISDFRMNLVALDKESLYKMIKEKNLLEQGNPIKENNSDIPEVILFNKYYDYRDANVNNFISDINEGDIIEVNIKGLDKNNNVIYKKQKVKVAGFFSKSWLDLNDSERLVPDMIMSLEDYENIANLNTFTSIKVSFNSENKNDSINKVIKMMESKRYFDYDTFDKVLKEMNAISWQMKLKKLSTSYILGLLTMVNIFFIIVANVIIRKKDYSIMRAIGMPKKVLRSIIIKEGLFYSLLGSIIGIIMILLDNIRWTNHLQARSIAKGFEYTGKWYDLPYKYIIIFVILSILICIISSLFAYKKTKDMNFIDLMNED